MKLELWCDGVAFLKKVGRLYTTPQGGRCYKITSIRPQGQMALLQLEGVSDMDAARAAGQVFYLTVTMPPCLRASGMWPTSLGVKCGMRYRQGVRRGDQRGPPRCTGYLHRQGSRRQGIYVPRVDAF